MPESIPGADVGDVLSSPQATVPAKGIDKKNSGSGKGLLPHGNVVAGIAWGFCAQVAAHCAQVAAHADFPRLDLSARGATRVVDFVSQLTEGCTTSIYT